MIAFTRLDKLNWYLAGDMIQGDNGKFTLTYPRGEDTVMSVNPSNGNIEMRPKGTNGPWESFLVSNDKMIFFSDNKITVFGFVDTKGLE